MRIIKDDYPFKFIVEDKIGKTSGKLYQSISLAHTIVANKDATDPKEKYKTEWIGFFDEKDLLKLSKLCQTTYDSVKLERENQKKANKEYAEVAKETPADDLVPF